MLYVEPARAPGFLTSPRVEKFIHFLETTGGAPPDACYLLFRRAGELFKKARGAGYAVQARLEASVIWLPTSHRVVNENIFREQEALGWFYARLLQAGGRVENGVVTFPAGQRGRVYVAGKDVVAVLEGGKGKYLWDISALREKTLDRAVRKG